MNLQMTFIDDSSTVEHARKWGHTHIDEVRALPYSLHDAPDIEIAMLRRGKQPKPQVRGNF